MASAQPITLGQRFRDLQARSFGRPGLEWIVESLLTGSDGIEYARVVCATDPTRRKTLSRAVLGERSRYQRVGS